jgi:hypothetical protein
LPEPAVDCQASQQQKLETSLGLREDHYLHRSGLFVRDRCLRLMARDWSDKF